MPKLNDLTYVAVCRCDNPECSVMFNDSGDSLMISAQLNDYLPLWRRVILAVRYIFQRAFSWPHWSEILVDHYEVRGLIEFLSRFEDRESKFSLERMKRELRASMARGGLYNDMLQWSRDQANHPYWIKGECNCLECQSKRGGKLLGEEEEPC